MKIFINLFCSNEYWITIEKCLLCQKEYDDKGFYYKNKLEYQRKEIEDLLLIIKIRNRYYISKEKLDKFEPSKYI